MRLAAALLAAAAIAAPAGAQAASAPPGGQPTLPQVGQERVPEGWTRSARGAIRIADRRGEVRAARREHGPLRATGYQKGDRLWQVSYFDREGDEEAQVLLADPDGRVIEAWTGAQVRWTMARGYDGAFGRRVNSPWVWIPLCVLFVLPFVDPRRPRRLLHLDLLAIVSFSASLYFFNRGEIGVSVPLAYPPLLYLLARMLALARHRESRRSRPPLRLLVPWRWLAIGAVFLAGFRIGLNVVDSNVIDVGYSGVLGADRLADGAQLYGDWPPDNRHGDTYGPVVYEAYVPFEQALPWSGRWDDLPAAHAAAITFDLLTMGGLALLGLRLRGPRLAAILAYAWAACPFTLYVLATNSNDALVAALLVALMLVMSSTAARRGAVAALAGLTKFAPLALAPMAALRLHGRGPARRRLVAFTLAFAAVCAVALAPALLHSGPLEIARRTLGFQIGRESPFSIWGQADLEWLQALVGIGVVALALAAAWMARAARPVRVAALGAAVLLALQLVAEHWFYLYLAWFLPYVLVALFARHREPAPA